MNPLRSTALYIEWAASTDEHAAAENHAVRPLMRAILSSIDQSDARATPRDLSIERRALTAETAQMKERLAEFLQTTPHRPSVEDTYNYLGILTSLVVCQDPRIEKTGTMAYYFALNELTSLDPVTERQPVLDLVFGDDPRKPAFASDFAQLTAARFFDEAKTEVRAFARQQTATNGSSTMMRAVDFDRLNALADIKSAEPSASLSPVEQVYGLAALVATDYPHANDCEHVLALTDDGQRERRRRLVNGSAAGRPAYRT